MGGIIVIRDSNPKESTLEGWGLVDSMPTGRHFVGRVYDDVVTEKHSRSTEMIAKATNSWELSLNLGSHGGYSRYVGTRYNYNDVYRTLMQREAAEPRIHVATKDGKVEGEPVLITREALAKKRRTMGAAVFGAQMMQDPKSDTISGFNKDNIRYYDPATFSPAGMNLYLLCDPANEKKKSSDYTAMVMIGMGADGNKYLVDGIRDRLGLKERTSALIKFHRFYSNKGCKPHAVGYEKYGKDSDIQHIESQQELDNYRFDITALGGAMAKNDRIRRMIPDTEAGIWYLPRHLFKTDYQGRQYDLVEYLINEELDPFPVAMGHDDLLDVISRIYDEDLNVVAPRQVETYNKPQRKRSAWVR